MVRLFLFTSILFSVTVQAQSYDKWEIYQNRKEVSTYNNKKETPDERKILLLNRALEGPGFFVIEFTPAAGRRNGSGPLHFIILLINK